MIRRQREIMYYLMKLNEPIIGEKISEIFSVSIRTIRDDIKKINEEVKEIGVKISSSKDNGYFLTAHDKEKIKKDNYFIQFISNKTSLKMPETPQERVTYIILKLGICGRLNIYDLEDELYVSISTLQQDLKKLRKLLEDKFYDIQLFIKGSIIEIQASRDSRMNLIGGIFSQTNDEVLLMKYMNYIFDETYYNKYNMVYVLLAKMEREFDDKLIGSSLRSLAFDIIICFFYRNTYPIIVEEKDDLSFCSYIIELEKRLLEIDIRLELNDYKYLMKRYNSKIFLVKKNIYNNQLMNNIISDFNKSLKEQFNIQLDDNYIEYKFITILNTILVRLENNYYYDEHFRQEMFDHNPLPFLVVLILERSIKKYCNYTLEKNGFYLLASSLSCYLRKNYEGYNVYLVCNSDAGYCDNFSRLIEEKSSSKIHVEKCLSSMDYYVNKRYYDNQIIIVNSDEFGFYDKNVIGIEKIEISQNEIKKIEELCVDNIINKMEIDEVMNEILYVVKFKSILTVIADDLKLPLEEFVKLIKNKLYRAYDEKIVIPYLVKGKKGVVKSSYSCNTYIGKIRIKQISVIQIGNVDFKEMNAITTKFFL